MLTGAHNLLKQQAMCRPGVGVSQLRSDSCLRRNKTVLLTWLFQQLEPENCQPECMVNEMLIVLMRVSKRRSDGGIRMMGIAKAAIYDASACIITTGRDTNDGGVVWFLYF